MPLSGFPAPCSIDIRFQQSFIKEEIAIRPEDIITHKQIEYHLHIGVTKLTGSYSKYQKYPLRSEALITAISEKG